MIYGAAMAVIFAAMAAHLGLFLAHWQSKSGVWQPTPEVEPVGLVLRGPEFLLTREQGILWQSEPGWRVQDYAVGDLDGDGGEDLLLLVWRRGSYGPFRPFWVERNHTETFTQHIFIYHWDEERSTVEPIWMSSRLAPEVKRWSMTPEGDLRILTPAGEDTLWGWRTWGLVRLE